MSKHTKIKKYFSQNKKEGGFVILFAVMLSSIILAITLGVANISFREIKFSTGAKETNDAFFAADAGAECALVNDKTSGNSFIEASSGKVNCLGGSIDLVGSYPFWSFTIIGLGGSGNDCAKVTVDKTDPLSTIVVSRGYNNGGVSCLPSTNTVERQLELSY